MKPRVYRTQSEKDTWYAVAVENEYQAPMFKESDVVVDIGAHIGSFSYLAHRLGSRRVYGFEIDSWHVEAAEANLEGLDGVELNHLAVVRGDDKRNPHYYYDGKWNVFGDTGEEIDSAALDDVIETVGPIRFLKIDCEGGEWPILYTCTQLDQIQEIAGEYHENINFHDDSLPRTRIISLAKFLFDKGFTRLDYTDNVPGIGNFSARRPGS